jgi:D-alanyl-D-alanine endopeptidase (penicillin-binding protein 7)
MDLTLVRRFTRLVIGALALALLSLLPIAPGTAEAASASKSKPAAGAKQQARSGSKAKPRASAKSRAKAGPSRKAGPRKKVRRAAPRPPSVGQLTGLRATEDPLSLQSSVALVVDQETDEVLFSKNSEAVLPIASITKLMTALVVVDAGLSLDERLVVSQDDVRGTVGSRMRSKLRPGTRLSRGELMHLSLMSSENRAAHALGRTYPGGLGAFVRAMNRKAAELGMADTRYVEPTGLSADNRSSAVDLARLVKAASEHPVIRDLSTSLGAVIPVGPKPRPVAFRNTNGLVHNPEWDIGLQKTGFIAAAGRCVVMQAELAGRQMIMVLLDSAGRYSRIGDAERLRRWLAEQSLLPVFGRRAEPMPEPVKPQPSLAAPAPTSLPILPAVPMVPAAAPWSPAPKLSTPVPAIDPTRPWVQVPALPLQGAERAPAAATAATAATAF